MPGFSRKCMRALSILVVCAALLLTARPSQAADAVPLPTSPDWVSEELTNGACLVWGDLDGDGDLDMIPGAVGTPGATDPNLLIYLNEGSDPKGRLRFTVQRLAVGAVNSCALVPALRPSAGVKSGWPSRR